MEGVKMHFTSTREMEKWRKCGFHLRGRGKSRYSSYLRKLSNKGERHKPRQLEGNIQAVFAQVLSGEIGPKWIH